MSNKKNFIGLVIVGNIVIVVIVAITYSTDNGLGTAIGKLGYNVLQAFVNGIVGLYFLSRRDRRVDLGQAFLLGGLVVLIVGFSLCLAALPSMNI